MSSRNAPIQTVGLVAIYAPSAKGYYRLKWIEPDGSRGDTTAGRSIEEARAKATELAVRLSRAASPFAVVTLQDIVEEFLTEGRSPYRKRRTWQKAQKNQIRRSLARSIAGDEHLQAMDITRSVLDRMRARGGTDNMVRANTTALRGLLYWGYQSPKRYFSPEQAELLPRAGVRPAPSKPSRIRPLRETSVHRSGDGLDYISNEDAPSADLAVGLGNRLHRCFPAWGRLSVEFAANVGARWGEQFQLDVHDIHLDGCADHSFCHVHIDYQVDAGANAGSRASRLTLPKGKKRRVVPIARTSFTGYALRDEVRARRDAALAEQATGENSDAYVRGTEHLPIFPSLLPYAREIDRLGTRLGRTPMPSADRLAQVVKDDQMAPNGCSRDGRDFLPLSVQRFGVLVPVRSRRCRTSLTDLPPHSEREAS
ncbi:hypothetical protein C6I20_05340 [Aeromicrobium sp. A1-2]|uniref:hypothetical protein n=1 Tax=Aeromicrobium sp. A1-2 TaxID=2107713 RepID=UPI000E4BB952|nr:hypothetical protein [Aeromicrobium sp. A1-2]AXT84671.1 hypothetical protein C6I20_05340 [Aeromicrobium sp. A1-2]